MDIQTLEIVQTANRLVDTLGTRDPHRIARELGIEVVPVDFKRQRGAYKVLMRNRFIFIKNDLHPVMERIVMLHEIGHDVLHRKEAVKAGGFKEFNIFNILLSKRSCQVTLDVLALFSLYILYSNNPYRLWLCFLIHLCVLFLLQAHAQRRLGLDQLSPFFLFLS